MAYERVAWLLHQRPHKRSVVPCPASATPGANIGNTEQTVWREGGGRSVWCIREGSVYDPIIDLTAHESKTSVTRWCRVRSVILVRLWFVAIRIER
jgi:hypothetical protein